MLSALSRPPSVSNTHFQEKTSAADHHLTQHTPSPRPAQPSHCLPAPITPKSSTPDLLTGFSPPSRPVLRQCWFCLPTWQTLTHSSGFKCLLTSEALPGPSGTAAALFDILIQSVSQETRSVSLFSLLLMRLY